jgi:hypothetical protein
MFSSAYWFLSTTVGNPCAGYIVRGSSGVTVTKAKYLFERRLNDIKKMRAMEAHIIKNI